MIFDYPYGIETDRLRNQGDNITNLSDRYTSNFYDIWHKEIRKREVKFNFQENPEILKLKIPEDKYFI
jgi:hypothetical protein